MLVCAFPILPILCLILSGSPDFVHLMTALAVRLRMEFGPGPWRNGKQEVAGPKPTAIELRNVLATRIAVQAQSAGEHSTAVPGLTLFRRTAPSPCYRATYEPSLTVFVQGPKADQLGGTVYLCDGSSFLLSSIDVPVRARLSRPRKGALALDASPARYDDRGRSLAGGSPETRSLFWVATDLRLVRRPLGYSALASDWSSFSRLPEDVPFLGPLVQREIMYRVLSTPQGRTATRDRHQRRFKP